MRELTETAPPPAPLQSRAPNLVAPEFLRERVLDDRASKYGKTVIERDYRMPRNGKTISILLTTGGGHRDPYILFPLTDGDKVIIVRQYRYGPNGWVFELPGGCVNPGQDWHHCARKELLEETGATARSMEIIGKPMLFNPALETTYFHAVLATGCQIIKAQHLDRSETMEVVEISLIDFRRAVREGAIYDSKSVAIGYLALDHLGLL